MKVGVIGPTDLDKLVDLMGGSQEAFLGKAAQIGRILAETECCELWVNPDGGMLAAVAEAYKDAGGKKLVVLVPKARPWPITHIQTHAARADKIVNVADWFHANYQVVSTTDVCICVGLSAGVHTELGYIKWDAQFQCGNLQTLIVIKELVRGGVLPPEIEANIGERIHYINTVDELPDALGACVS